MGNAIRTWFILLCVGLCSSPAIPSTLLAQDATPQALYDRSRALVIGIEQYPQGRSVPGAVDEAKQVAQAFRQLGFEEITELYNKDATARRMHQALTDLFAKKVDRSGRVVVFFAGQTGVTRDGKGRDMGYLIPADAQASNVAKFLTVETIKEFTKRSPSKHTLLIVNAPFRAWEAPVGKPSVSGETDARAVQVIAAVPKDEKSAKQNGKTLFVQALLTGLSGAADLNQNGWLAASELGAYIQQQAGAISVRIDGEGDTILSQQRKPAPPVLETQQRSNDREAAKAEYEQALALLQGGKYAEEALMHLNRAIEADPTFGEAYMLKSYLRLELLPQLDEALAAGREAVKYAPDNADAFYTLGQVEEKMGRYKEAEEAFVQAAKLNPENPDVFFALGTLYEDQLNESAKSVQAFRRYLELGGVHARARAAVSQADQAVLPPAEPLR